MARSVPVLIATPLEPELAQRVANLDPRVELLYEPDLLPPSRWVGDTGGDPSFRRDPESQQRFEGLLGQAEVLYGMPGGSGEGLADALRRAPGVRWVHGRNAGAGEQVADAVQIAPDELASVVVTTSSGAHVGPLAEFCMLGLLAFVKDLPRLEHHQAERFWPEQPAPGIELRGRTLVVAGLGAIGREITRLAEAFGMRVIGVRRNPSRAAGEQPPERLPQLAAKADDMAVTLPLTDATRGMVDADTLAALGPGGVFVNVGRGGVVDEAALVERLRDGTLAGAALDVFECEPLPADSPLWTLPNVILSPHSAALVAAEPERVLDLFLGNLARYLEGEPLRNEVNTEVFY